MPLEPHSQEWFDRMAKVNPQQARQTLQIVRLAGRNDVCSICGDPNSKAYKLIDDATMTLRLCDDCRKLQKEMYGLSVDPL